MSTHPYQYSAAGNAVFGPGVTDALTKQRPLKKASRVLVLSDAGVTAAGITERVQKALGDKCALTETGVVPDASVAHIEETATRARAENIDAIVAVGGGSVIDTAKCVAAVIAKDASLESLEGFATVRAKLMPVVCLPTTAGTGAEASQFAVVMHREQGRKLIISDVSLVPALGVLDPELVVGLPAAVTAATGVDTLTHAVEALASRMGSPFGAALAMDAARRVAAGALERSLAEPGDLDARGEMLTAANLAGVAISMNMLGAVHAFGHALGALKGVPHGVANGIFLVPVMRMNMAKARPAYAHLGRALGGSGDEESLAEHAIAEVQRVVHDVAGIPERLVDLDVTEADVDAFAALVMKDPDLPTNPVRIKEVQQVTELIRARL